jgi:predicted protein tyrosine phosphatase
MSARIHVCPLSAVDTLIAAHGPSHVVTLINRDLMIDTPAGIAPENHLKLGMNDIAAPADGFVAPGEAHVADLLRFTLAWDRRAPMLIHCWAGISRSTAAAFVALCALNPEADELAVARTLRGASPEATPNARIVALADGALGRQGRMVAAVAAIGRGELAIAGRPFALPAAL